MIRESEVARRGLMRIAVYAEHTTRAGQQVLGDYDPESDDIHVYEGTTEDMRLMAQKKTSLLTAAMAYQRKIGRTILAALGSKE